MIIINTKESMKTKKVVKLYIISNYILISKN